MQKQLAETLDPQISTTDPDSRALLIHGQVVEVSYNQQAAVDAKHNLVVATHTINRNDRNALSAIAHEGQTFKTKGTWLRGLQKVNGEMALIMTVYNVKRLLNILE